MELVAVRRLSLFLVVDRAMKAAPRDFLLGMDHRYPCRSSQISADAWGGRGGRDSFLPAKLL